MATKCVAAAEMMVAPAAAVAGGGGGGGDGGDGDRRRCSRPTEAGDAVDFGAEQDGAQWGFIQH